MKSLITTLAVAAATACMPASARAQSPVATPTASTLTWNAIARDAITRAKPTQHQAARLLAYLSLAQYATLSQDPSALPDALATASMRVIADLAPSQAAFAQERMRELGARESDQGGRVAQHVLARAHSDDFNRKLADQAVQGAYAWRSLAQPPAPPAYPGLGAMRTFVMDSGSAIRLPPPPGVTSARFRSDIEEVHRYTASPTAETTRIAKFYDMTTGTLAAGFWNEQAAVLIAGNKMSEMQSARVLAAMNVAIMDALIACHDSKYVYWVPRPSQADGAIKPLIGVPNHPSYPSNHSCLSTAAAQVLAHFFPGDRGRLDKIATEAGVSRIYAGLHYRFDVDAGDDIGRKVAAAVVSRHEDVLARWTQAAITQAANP